MISPVSEHSASHRFNQLSRRQWTQAVMVAIAAVVLRSLFANRSGFWLDEFYTLDAALKPFSGLIKDRLAAGHSPIFFFYAKLFLLFGDSPRILRLSAAIMTGVAVLFASGLAGRLQLHRHLPAVWTFALLQPYWCTTGNEYRYMTTVIAFSLLTAWIGVHYTDGWRLRRGVALALAFGFLLALHASIMFLAPAFVIWLGWETCAQARRWSAGRIARAVWPIAAGILLALPLLMMLKGNKAQKAPHFPRLERTQEDLIQLSFGNPYLWPRWLNFNHEVTLTGLFVLLLLVIWLTRRQLARESNLAPWRLLITWFAGVPLFVLLLTSTWREVQGPERYICTITCPAVFFAAIAWNTDFPRRLRRLWRVVLGFAMFMQSGASLLDAGDLHREAVHWLARNNSGSDPVYLSTYKMNLRAFDYYRFPCMEQVFSVAILDAKHREIARSIQERVGSRKHVFCMYYHDKGQQFEAIQELLKSGFFAAHRVWRFSAEVTLLAAITDPAERPWLDSLPGPVRPWGPACGYDKYNPAYGIPRRFRGYY